MDEIGLLVNATLMMKMKSRDKVCIMAASSCDTLFNHTKKRKTEFDTKKTFNYLPYLMLHHLCVYLILVMAIVFCKKRLSRRGEFFLPSNNSIVSITTLWKSNMSAVVRVCLAFHVLFNTNKISSRSKSTEIMTFLTRDDQTGKFQAWQILSFQYLISCISNLKANCIAVYVTCMNNW